MRIAMISRYLPRLNYAGGVSGQVHLLANELTRRGHDVEVFGLTPAPTGAFYKTRLVAEAPGGGHNRFAFHYLLPWWLRQINFKGYDVVHSHGDDHLLQRRVSVIRTFYGSALAEAWYSRRARHSLYHLTMCVPEVLSALKASTVVAISVATARHIPRVAAIVPCAVPLARFAPASAKSPTPSILFVGEPWTRKRGELLAAVFARDVRPALPAVELWVVSERCIAGEGIRWFGRVSEAELIALYQRAWVFCMPSRYEGFGVPYLEAMACGTPVVATPNGGAHELLDGGRFGVVVPDERLGPALLDLLGSPAARADLAARGLARATEYDIVKICDRYEEIYQRAIAGLGCGSGVPGT